MIVTGEVSLGPDTVLAEDASVSVAVNGVVTGPDGRVIGRISRGWVEDGTLMVEMEVTDERAEADCRAQPAVG